MGPHCYYVEGTRWVPAPRDMGDPNSAPHAPRFAQSPLTRHNMDPKSMQHSRGVSAPHPPRPPPKVAVFRVC